MKLLFIDTETTGLPKDYKAPASKTDNWPRLVEIGYIMTDENDNNPTRRNLIAKPDGFIIPTEASDVHGIVTKDALERGVHIRYILRELESYINQADIVIAHNYNFDSKIIGAEYHRQGMPDPLDGKNAICTCDNQTIVDYCALPGKWPGKFKWPKLKELFSRLYCYEFEEQHSALADIQATADCYFELKKREVI